MSAFWSRHVGAAAGCCLRVLLSEWPVRSGAGMPPLQGAAGAAVRVVCALWRACWCRCRVKVLPVRLVCALLSGHAGAAAGCRLLSE